jgi:hypothetical protein
MLILGCTAPYTPYLFTDYQIGAVDSANVGDVMLSASDGTLINEKSGTFIGMTREILYGGISGSVITVLYREYNVSLEASYVRQAFSMPAQYDLSLSKDLTFRDNRIRVLDAGPAQVRFIVLADGSEYKGQKDSTAGSMIPTAKRQLVRISLQNGTTIEGYIVAETETKVYLSSERLATKASSSLPRAAIKSMKVMK